MPTPYEILGVGADATAAVIRAAFEAEYDRWRRLKTIPQRADEAEERLRQIEAAYEGLMSQHKALEAGLEYRPTGHSAARSKPIPPSSDPEHCPNCGYGRNPPDARFCANCRGKLFQNCPSCQAELPWHYANCYRCGTNLAEFLEKQRLQERQRKLAAIESKQRRLAEIASDREVALSRGLFLPSEVRERLERAAGPSDSFDLRGRWLWGGIWILLSAILGIAAASLSETDLCQPFDCMGCIVLCAILSISALPVIAGLIAGRLKFRLFIRSAALAGLEQEEQTLRREINELSAQS
jgi:hypothetical protein